MKLFIPVIILLCAHMGVVRGQTQLLDSLTRDFQQAKDDSTRLILLEELSWNLWEHDPIKSHDYALEELELAKKLGNRMYEAYAYNNLAGYYQGIPKIDSAILLQKKVMAIGQEMKSDRTIASSYNNLGIYYFTIDSYDSAIRYYLRSLSLYEKLDNKSGMSRVVNNVAGVFSSQKNNKQAIEYYRRALGINKAINDSSEMATNYLNLGLSYQNLDKPDSAFKYFKLSKVFCDLLKNDLTNITVLVGLGDVAEEKKNYDEALSYYKQSIAMAEKHNTRFSLAEGHLRTGDIYRLQSRYVLSEQEFTTALTIGEEIGAPTLIRRAYKGMHRLYAAQHNFKKAYEYQLLHATINDSIYDEERAKGISELNIQYETARKEQQIKLNEVQIESLEKQASIDGLRKTLLGTALLAVLLVGGFGVFGFWQRLQRHKVERQKEKEVFEKEISFKKKELATHTLHLVQKSELLESIKGKLEDLKKEPEFNKNAINRLIQVIKNDEQSETDWKNFQTYFEQVHETFDQKLRDHFNDLTNNEVRLAALLKMNLSSKEIASILNISPDSVNKARYRLRKKLNLSSDDSLEGFLLAL